MPVVPTYFQQSAPAMSRPSDAPASATLPLRPHQFPNPKVRLHLNDVGHDGSSVFLSNVKGNEDLGTQIQNVLSLLYHSPASTRPGTRSVTFILRDFAGIAYTTGSELDDDHKEIHISLSFLAKLRDARDEILGVVCHELVHCFQYAAGGTAPGGLIEGIADWVRLNAGLAAKHWKQDANGRWDGGYQHTGYFLEYLEQRFGSGTVRKINGGLREGKYDEKRLFTSCCDGKEVAELWRDYGDELRKKRERENMPDKTEESQTIPTDTPPKPHGDCQ